MCLDRLGCVLVITAALVLLAGLAAPASGDSSDRAPARPGGADGVHVVAIDNGPVVLFKRIPGAACVAIEEIHPVGLVHDPAGITQGTHLVEHLRCMGATASFAAGESFSDLGAMGMCNAETMGDLTHYDIVVPRGDLDLALSVIAERAGSLAPDAGLIAQEAPRCHAEVDGVLHALRSPGFKFSLAAAAQSWRHGRAEASLRSGLEAWAPAEVGAFITATHAPSRMTITIVGDLDPDEVEDAARRHFGALAAHGTQEDGGAGPLGPIAYEELPADATVEWDVDSSAVFVLYPPPADPDERLALTLWCAGIHAQLSGRFPDGRDGPMVNVLAYPVGELPVLAYLPVAPGADAGERAANLGEAVEAFAAGPGSRAREGRSMAMAMAMTFEHLSGPNAYEQGVGALAARVGPDQAERLAAGNVALQLGLMAHAFGPDPGARLAELRARDDAWWDGVVRRTIHAGQRRTTRLVPAGD